MAKTKKPKDEAAPEVVEKHPGGRPSSKTPEICNEIIERLMVGQSLREICRDEHMPDRVTVFRWIRDDAEFRSQYAIAREVQADEMADDILDIADDAQNDWMERFDREGNSIGWVVNGEHVQRSRLRIESRKWLMGKLRPKVYGDKVEVANTHSGPDGKPIESQHTERVYRYVVQRAEPFSLEDAPDAPDT